ncbi:MAG: hypothetical protein FJX57_09505, partial [Alphaproteobacteria bacterium]|nr:hypothetical protein [Alphaproteobacteria bacterium]
MIPESDDFGMQVASDLMMSPKKTSIIRTDGESRATLGRPISVAVAAAAAAVWCWGISPAAATGSRAAPAKDPQVVVSETQLAHASSRRRRAAAEAAAEEAARASPPTSDAVRDRGIDNVGSGPAGLNDTRGEGTGSGGTGPGAASGSASGGSFGAGAKDTSSTGTPR